MHNKAPEYHIPVLGPEVSDHLISDRDGIYVDATLGGGGHAESILSELSPQGSLIGIDRDPEAITKTSQRLARFEKQVVFHQVPFWQLPEILTEQGVTQIAGILFDLGLSSHQIDTSERGFSFQQSGPLDMRMGPDANLSASEVVNTYSQQDLTRIFFTYGEERTSPAIARAICRVREEEPIATTIQLADLIDRAVRGPHIQKTLARIFQAIRIEVNNELAHLEHIFQTAVDLLQPGGRIAVLSYHSLEHRIVKQVFQTATRECISPLKLPICPCDRQPMLRVIAKGIRPKQADITTNSRARSATLRVAEKLDAQNQSWIC
ncbi:MAG: 16S rRNA (cytosine(1402)-N(4))-methyltransferase RsmH, partial [Candidatus Latescibacteria bacterium]|nr:16S rRNA (cytosine(1402)-N(4))-methyltransferase RsmH [Candidatus Latescibacterota bacterium]